MLGELRDEPARYARGQFIHNMGFLALGGAVTALVEPEASFASPPGLPALRDANPPFFDLTLPFLQGRGNAEQLASLSTLEVTGVTSLFAQAALLLPPHSVLIGGPKNGISSSTLISGVNQLSSAISAKEKLESNCPQATTMIIVVKEQPKCGKIENPLKAAAAILQALSAIQDFGGALNGNPELQNRAKKFIVGAGYAAKVSSAIRAKNPAACAQALDRLLTALANRPEVGLHGPARQTGHNPLIKLLTALAMAALIIC